MPSVPHASGPPDAPDPSDTPARFRPRLTLQTLTRGDGLLGLRARPGFGPRGAQVTVARVDWTYVADGGLGWETPAPDSVLNRRPPRDEWLRGAWNERVLLRRDLAGEAQARDALWDTPLRPLPASALQWRHPDAAEGHENLWSLPEEAHFGDFWADVVPRLQALGWSIVVQPGFAHFSVPVQAWRLVVDAAGAESTGRELAGPLGPREQPLVAMRSAPRTGSWLLSLGIEVEGEALDLAPLLADLLARDARWLDARELAAIDDAAIVRLRAPGGRRIDAPAAPLKAIVGALVDLLTEPRRAAGPLLLSTWEAHRLEALRAGLADTMAARAGARGGWQLRGEAGLATLAQRLRAAGTPPAVAPPADRWRWRTPLPAQGLAWLQYLREHRLAGILADDMGLGKTVQVLAHLLVESEAGRLGAAAAEGRAGGRGGEGREGEGSDGRKGNDSSDGSESSDGRDSGESGDGGDSSDGGDGGDGIDGGNSSDGRDSSDSSDSSNGSDGGRAGGAPALIVLPSSLIANWQAEAARFAPGLRLLTLQGASRSRDFGRLGEYDVVLTTYPLLWRDIDALQAQRWHLLILDEAQTVKNAGSRAAGALRRLQATHRLCVTGTPLENHLGELWAHFDLLMPGFLGDARSFARVWRKPIEENGETLRARLLSQRVRPFILRRRKDEVATELPPKTEVIRRVALQGRQRALYESVRVAADRQVRRTLKRQGFAGSQIAILDALLKLRQVCCDPRLVAGARTPPTMERAKLELLLDTLPPLVDEGRRVLVFSQFTGMLALVGEALDEIGLPHFALTGNTPVRERGALVRRFQALERPVLLVSLKAGGVGLNLTAADTVIHLDPWWNPAVERQATDRAHRIGQDRPVFVYRYVVEGSIEERMLELQARKSALAEGVLGHDAAGAVKFSADDLDALLAPLDDVRPVAP